MPNPVTFYQTVDGVQFNKFEEASKHEHFLFLSKNIMKKYFIDKTPNGNTYVQHKKGTVKKATDEFIRRIGAPLCGTIKIILERQNGEDIPADNFDYYLHDVLIGHLRRHWVRLLVMDPDTDREYEQLYYRNHPRETREATQEELRNWEC